MKYNVSIVFQYHHENKVVSDIFQFARHKKLQYQSSTSKASFCFELVHFDIWGPLIIKPIHGCRYFLLSLMILADMFGS